MKDTAWLLDKIKNPASLEASDQAELREIIAEFPFFSLPYLLLARQMHQHKHPAYEQLLPVISLRAQDRKKLFKLVHEWSEPQPQQATGWIEEVKEPEVGHQEAQPASEPEPTEEAIEDQNIEEEVQEEVAQEEESIGKSRFSLDASGIEHNEKSEASERKELSEIPFGKAREELEEGTEESPLETEDEAIQEADAELDTLESVEQEELVEDSIQLEETRQEEELNQEVKDNVELSLEAEEVKAEANQTARDDQELEESIEPDEAKVEEATDLPVEAKSPEEEESEKEPVVAPGGSMENFFSWLDKFDQLKEEEARQMEPESISASIVRSTPVEPEGIEPEAKAPIEDQLDIIDQFIEKQPSVSRVQGEFYNPAMKAKESEQLEDDMVTETLAKIFLQQERYERALEAYQKLQLKYPEKNAYFAALISEINEKIK